MKRDGTHIRQIKVVSNTHWDREFRRSFEKTRRRLLTMLDFTLDLLERDPAYHSFTMDGHSIMIDDYLELRPERRESVERLVRQGRLVLGPYYTLVEQFSVSGESLVRNLIWGRRTVEKYGGQVGTVAYTPSSWGQTGQLPQILRDFGLTRMMFYRGISHHEADAEWIWEAPDGSRVDASRFALYARYNWYYQVHRPVTVGRTFEKDYVWGQRDEVPLRFADGLAGEDLAFDLKEPQVAYDKSRLKQAIEEMIEREGPHFTTPVFLAMHGHDISVPHPLESQIIADAQELLSGRYDVRHADLESFWNDTEPYLAEQDLPVLHGERRSYLKQGMWTYLFPGTISARTYLKQQDFATTVKLVSYAEPLACMAMVLGEEYPHRYMQRGWTYLLSNHTHDANGGCAPDAVCKDMEYRYRKASDIADIVVEDAISYVARNLSPEGLDREAMLLVVFNPLPFERDSLLTVDLEVPARFGVRAVRLTSPGDPDVPRQPISASGSGAFVDSIWDVPTVLESVRLRFHARLRGLPALGYRTYMIQPDPTDLRPTGTLVTGAAAMENEYLAVAVNPNGTVDITCKQTGRVYRDLNYLSDEGEVGNAWQHLSPTSDRKYNSLGVRANIAIVESGPLVSVLSADFVFPVPADCADGTSRTDRLVGLPIRAQYRLEAGADHLRVTLDVDNKAKDHWLRVNFPTDLATDCTIADSHFDILSRPIALPDSTGWVEAARGTHPLRTFVCMSDGDDGLALLPLGLFEYEALNDARRTLALTLIRACRIKLAVSEEKQTELPDAGVQCPGPRRFEYAVCVFPGSSSEAALLRHANDLATPVRAVMAGRGRGAFPPEATVLAVDNPDVSVSAVKAAEDGSGLIVRLFNPQRVPQSARLSLGRRIGRAWRCRMDEAPVEELPANDGRLQVGLPAKKIVTLRVTFE